MNAQWVGYKFKGNPDKVAEEIKNIAIKSGREEAKTEDIFEYARTHKDSELHKCYTWDRDEAAHKWWMHETRLIVGSIRLVYKEAEDKEPVTFRLFTKNGKDQGYKPIIFTMRNKDEYAKLLETAREELRIFKQKYKVLTELEDIFSLIDEI